MSEQTTDPTTTDEELAAARSEPVDRARGALVQGRPPGQWWVDVCAALVKDVDRLRANLDRCRSERTEENRVFLAALRDSREREAYWCSRAEDLAVAHRSEDVHDDHPAAQPVVDLMAALEASLAAVKKGRTK